MHGVIDERAGDAQAAAAEADREIADMVRERCRKKLAAIRADKAAAPRWLRWLYPAGDREAEDILRWTDAQIANRVRSNAAWRARRLREINSRPVPSYH